MQSDKRVNHLFSQCGTCRVCNGAAYQTPPVLGVFSETAKYLVIAQNPGEIKASDLGRRWWSDEFSSGMDIQNIKLFYEWDFITSKAYLEFSDVFGEGWLRSGMFSYTNSVRCRTPKNAPPSQEMIDACKTYTRSILILTGITRVITVGQIAARVIIGESYAWGRVVAKGKVKVLPIMHYASPSYDKVQTVEFVRKFMEDEK